MSRIGRQRKTSSVGEDKTKVYLLWHMQPLANGETDDKLLGVYSSRERALARVQLAKSLPGFIDQPDAFLIDEYSLDIDQWTLGFKILDD